MAKTLIDTYTEGDTLPKLQRTYTGTESGGNITGWTITLHLKRPDGTILTKTAAITDGPGGAYEFTWAAGDLQAGKMQEAEVQFDTGSGVFTEADLFFTIRSQLA